MHATRVNFIIKSKYSAALPHIVFDLTYDNDNDDDNNDKPDEQPSSSAIMVWIYISYMKG